MRLTELKCQECGAPIVPPRATDKYCCCGYCGMTYAIDRPFHPLTLDYEINIVPRYHNIDTLAVQAKVPDEAFYYHDKKEIETWVRQRLAISMADKLTNYLTIYKNMDIETMNTIYEARLKVVEP